MGKREDSKANGDFQTSVAAIVQRKISHEGESRLTDPVIVRIMPGFAKQGLCISGGTKQSKRVEVPPNGRDAGCKRKVTAIL